MTCGRESGLGGLCGVGARPLSGLLLHRPAPVFGNPSSKPIGFFLDGQYIGADFFQRA
jgi:hypothetical protein